MSKSRKRSPETRRRWLEATLEQRRAWQRDYWRLHKPPRKDRVSTVPRAAHRPTPVDLAWAAGFLEGEGGFCGQSSGRSVGGMTVQATQVQREPLDRLVRMFGGTIGFVVSRKPNHSNRHTWSISGARARGVALTLFLWLSPRRRAQVLAAIQPHRFPKLD